MAKGKSKGSAQPKPVARPEMRGKALCFVRGSTKPAVAPLEALYVLRHPDGSPMVAESTSDSYEACSARWELAHTNGTPALIRARSSAASRTSWRSTA